MWDAIYSPLQNSYECYKLKVQIRSTLDAQKKRLVRKLANVPLLRLITSFDFRAWMYSPKSSGSPSKRGHFECNETSEDQRKETNRNRLVKEQTIKFEHAVDAMVMSHCSVCRENKITFSNTTRKDISVDKTWKQCANKPNDHYITNNLQPIWYRTNKETGEKIPQFTIPECLQQLTVAEQLIIRRYAPYIPTGHMSSGNFGIKGHCVAFSQDLSEVCNELPRRKEEIVTFIREMGNKFTSDMLLKYVKVNRKRVLTALRWLKQHHSDYADIEIKEDNLSWMEGEEESYAIEHVSDINSNIQKWP